jgi:hypothetical protein
MLDPGNFYDSLALLHIKLNISKVVKEDFTTHIPLQRIAEVEYSESAYLIHAFL